MKIKLVSLFFFLLVQQTSHAQNVTESEEAQCARTISSITAILGQLKNNPSVRGPQIMAVIDGHTENPGLRAFIKNEIAPRIFSQDKKTTEIYFESNHVRERCLQALNSYTGRYGN